MRVLLVSTYELGRQPVHLASPAASLRAAGIDVDTLDLSVDRWDEASIEGVDAVAFSVPMHTAMRLALPVAREIRRIDSTLPIAFYGMYAGLGESEILGSVVDVLLIGEYEPDLVEWASRLDDLRGAARVRRHIGSSSFVRPDRSGLPGHDRYARLEWGGDTLLAAAVEASHGCRHRCRHCPVPVVYDGRMRVVGIDQTLADIDQLAGEGVRHVTFADPDFLNAPRYSMDLLRGAHADHPELTFDVTVKVEHILLHEGLWPEVARLGVLFVISAFETTDDATLEILAKDHTAADMARAVRILRDSGIHVRPTWLPFFPWTRPGDLVDISRFLDHQALWPATDPVQLAIKLLVPRGSLLESHPAMTPHLTRYEPDSLTWSWYFEDQETAALHRDLEWIAANASDCDAEARDTLATMRERIAIAGGVEIGPMGSWTSVPRLSESWFCCSEPTPAQANAVGLTISRVPLGASQG